MGKPTSIIIHHELGNNGFYSVNEYHRQLWDFKSSLNYYIGYQYYINKLGVVYQGREDDEEGAHCKGKNNNSVGICLQGDFDNERPTAVQIIALKNLILRLMTKWAIHPKEIYGHRIYASYKSCPGKLFKESELRELFEPNASYYQSLLNSLQDWLRNLQLRKLGSTASQCIDKDTKDN